MGAKSIPAYPYSSFRDALGTHPEARYAEAVLVTVVGPVRGVFEEKRGM